MSDFDEARQRHLVELARRLMALKEFAADPEWTNRNAQELSRLIRDVTEVLDMICRLNNAHREAMP